MTKTDYERTIEQFRSQLDDVWNKRKMDQLRGQIDDLRHNVDDLVKNYNRVMSTGADLLGETQRRITKQARDTAVEVTAGKDQSSFAWWIPVAVVGVAGAAYWLYSTLTSGATDTQNEPFSNYNSGSSRPLTSTESQHEPRQTQSTGGSNDN